MEEQLQPGLTTLAWNSMNIGMFIYLRGGIEIQKYALIFYFNCEWLVVECQMSNFSVISWWEHITCQWDEDNVHFVLDQHT